MVSFSSFKSLVRSYLKDLGYDASFNRINTRTNDTYQLCKALEYFNIDTVFDIGANTGQFSMNLRSMGYKNKIISFEPLSYAHQALLKASLHDSNWLVHPRSAVGDADCHVDINISNSSQSSSLLPMLEAHSLASPKTVYIGKEKVGMTQLDTVIPSYCNGQDNYFIKIDTQGFEWQVLNGARKTLSQAKGILCELSLIPLYEGQHLWRDVIDRLEAEGFTLWAIQKGFTNKIHGRVLQVDCIFFRL